MTSKRLCFIFVSISLIISGFSFNKLFPPQQSHQISPFGINAHLGQRFEGNSYYQERAANLLDDIGVAWTREEFSWAEIEPNPHIIPRVYRMSDQGRFNYNSAINSASYRNINILGLLTYGPSTNVITGDRYDLGACPPDVPENVANIDDWLQAWREFVHQVATQFGNKIDYWEIQNEENSACFWHKIDKGAKTPSPVDYLQILQAAYEEIKKIDPNDKILVGGMCPNDPGKCQDYYEYLTLVVDAGGWDYFDIIAIHPYRSPSAPEEVRHRSDFNIETLKRESRGFEYNMIDEIMAFRSLMKRWGQKPIWITEIGWSTHSLENRARERSNAVGDDISAEIVQSDYLIRSYIQALAAGVENILWYDFRDDDAYNEDESSMGIVYRDFDNNLRTYKPKPAFYAFSIMSKLLTGSTFDQQVQGQDDRWFSNNDVHEYRFIKNDQTIIVLWKSRGGDEPLNVTVKGIDSMNVQQYSPVFTSTQLSPSKIHNTIDMTVTVNLTERPIFLEYNHFGELESSTDEPSDQNTEKIEYPGIVNRVIEWWHRTDIYQRYQEILRTYEQFRQDIEQAQQDIEEFNRNVQDPEWWAEKISIWIKGFCNSLCLNLIIVPSVYLGILWLRRKHLGLRIDPGATNY